ncbi:MAG: ABC transporter ATP-binding protein [Spirochaetales bacterium]|nr:ABC transporter ATP-binding protein [Spirochaetales bacterium]
MKNAIEIKGLTKDYKDIRAVDNLDLEIREGELFSLLGVNGAGKTTTIKMLCCITTPTSGDALLNGKSIARNAEEVKKIIAVSPQETAVASNLSVEENLFLMCGVHGFDKEKARQKTAEMIEEFKLDRIRSKKASKLSGGWQRRLSIAMALISEPQILFLDEPTLGLDVIARSELWDSIRELKGKVTIILTTHYMEEAEELSDRIGVMRDGRLLAVGTAAELKELTGEDKFENAFIKLVKTTGKGGER